jgi:hypothetical protein
VIGESYIIIPINGRYEFGKNARKRMNNGELKTRMI